MWRVFVVLLVIAGIATWFAQIVGGPGDVATVDVLGKTIWTSTNTGILVFAFILLSAVLLGALLAYLIGRPEAVRRYMKRRTETRGHEAQTRGMIAVDVGDRDLAQQFAASAQRALPGDPLTSLLRVKAAQLGDDHQTARKLLEDMTQSPETELAGLHGLFLEARKEGETEAARQFAERAMKANPRLAWSSDALLEIQCRTGDWEGALETLAIAERQRHVDKKTAHRRRAVLLTAQAMEAERGAPDEALDLALEAHKLAPELVPAAAIAGHLLSSKGSPRHAARVISRTWRLSPNPELAVAYAYIRPGESPQERLARVQKLAEMAPDSIEGPIAVANAAIEAREWQTAREALAPYFEKRPPARICTAMARIEEGVGYTGRSREWLSRALRAPRDPAWTADGVVSKHWAPISPVTGALDAFEWKVPLRVFDPVEAALTIDKPQEALAAPGPGMPEPAAGLDVGGSDQSERAEPALPPEKAIDLPPEKAIDLADQEPAELPPEKAIDLPPEKAIDMADKEPAELPPEKAIDLEPAPAPVEADGGTATVGNRIGSDDETARRNRDLAPAPRERPRTKAPAEEIDDLDPLGGPPDRAS